MLKKSLILIVIMFLLTGCTIKYNLRIDENFVSEKLFINNVDVSKFNNTYVPVNSDIDDPNAFKEKSSEVEYYKMKKNDDSIILSYDHNFKNFSSAYILNSCYDEVDSYIEDNRFIISTTGSFSCFELYDDIDDVEVVINSQYKLINTNANKINNFDYIWNINVNNLNEGIYLELDLNDRKKTVLEEIQDSKLFNFVVLIIVIVVIMILFLLFRAYSRLKDKI